jgi:hypothetical protein
MSTQGKLKRRVVRRNASGFKDRIHVTHSITTRRSEHDYDIQYPPDVTDAEIVRDLRVLKGMASEQADAMDALDSFLNQTIISGGLSALITSVSAHFEKPHHCQLLLTFYINERRFWVTKVFEAGTPSQLPDSNFLTAFVTTYLNELAAD